MDGHRLIQSLKLRNLLSYGPEGVEIELLPLNVLIGPNASGKSNLVEAIGLLAAAPRDLTVPAHESNAACRSRPRWVGVVTIDQVGYWAAASAGASGAGPAAAAGISRVLLSSPSFARMM